MLYWIELISTDLFGIFTGQRSWSKEATEYLTFKNWPRIEDRTATLKSTTQTSESVWVEASGYLSLPDRSQIYPLQGTFSGTSQKPSSLLFFLIYREYFKYLSLFKPLYYVNVFHKPYNTFTTRRFSPFYNTYNQVFLCIAQH